jgi:hypothetical protein
MGARYLILLAALALALTAAAPAGAAGAEIGTSPVFSIGPGHVFVDWVPGANSTLVRTANGINISLQTSGLPAGHAVTMWALIFNNPSACGSGGCDESRGDLGIPGVQGSVQHVAGHVVGSTSTFAGHLAVGDAADAFTGPGLLNPFSAEIHLIVRDHGVASPDIITDQFNNDSPRFCNVACFDIQKSVHVAHQ